MPSPTGDTPHQPKIIFPALPEKLRKDTDALMCLHDQALTWCLISDKRQFALSDGTETFEMLLACGHTIEVTAGTVLLRYGPHSVDSQLGGIPEPGTRPSTAPAETRALQGSAAQIVGMVQQSTKEAMDAPADPGTR